MSWLWGGSSSDPAPTPKFPSTPGTNPPPPSTLSALGIGVASDPRAQKAATEFAQDEGVQDAASNFTRDKRVQQAFLTSVGLPGGAQQFKDDASGRPTRAKESSKTTTNRTKSNDVEGTTRTTKRKPSVAAMAAMAAFEDSETKRREKIGSGDDGGNGGGSRSSRRSGGGGENLKALEHSSGMTVIRREKGFGNLSEKNLKSDPLPPPPLPPPLPPLYLCDPCPHGNVPVSFKQQFQLYTFVGLMEEEREEEEREKEERERERGGEKSSSPPLLVDLLNKLYQDHTREGHHEEGEDVLSEFKKEEMTLSTLLHQYMNVEEPERRTLYYHNEMCEKEGRGKLAELMMRQIESQAIEDEKRRGWM